MRAVAFLVLATASLAHAEGRPRYGGNVEATLLGAPFTEVGIRRKLEQTYRALARATHDVAERHELIDQANAVRPRTWI